MATKARLRRMGKENPADVIVALAEEIDRYRAKIRSMDAFIAKRRGNETGLVAELRNKQSRDNRELLDRAADRIEELEAGYRKQIEGEWIYQEDDFGLEFYRCSLCGGEVIGTPKFCGDCGAKMKGGE